jgi:NADH-quinone oxidoreductase subunit C
MSQVTPEVLHRQEELHAYLEQSFPELKIEKDRNGESIVWARSLSEIPSLVERALRDERMQMDRLSDVTAYDNVDGKDGPQRFVLVYQLYSMKLHNRLRLKVLCGETEAAPSLTRFWAAANWLEREVYDMFGIRFEGHPDLRRILMDERFEGHPLRKEYPLEERQPFPDSLPVRIADRTAEGSKL